MTDTIDTPAEDDEERTPFSEWLAGHERGALDADLTEQFATLVLACQELGRMGTITVTVKVQPEDDGITTFVQADVKSNPPKPSRRRVLMYADDDGTLHQNDPYQQQLPLKELEQPPAAAVPLRVVNGEHVVDTTTGEVVDPG